MRSNLRGGFLQINQVKQTILKDFPQEIAALAQVTGELLEKKGLTVSTAESCTGGLISAALTSVAGSSAYYWGSVIAYDNKVKNKLLAVPQDVLQTKGAVSPEVAEFLALEIRNLIGTSVGIGVTGIAGPGGGTLEKPVGLVYIALNSDQVNWCQAYNFSGGRFEVRMSCVKVALELLRKYALEQE